MMIYYIGERLKLEGETEKKGVVRKSKHQQLRSPMMMAP